MKKTRIPILALTIVISLISCGENKQTKESKDTKDVSAKTIDACQWLSKSEVEALLDTKVGECRSLINHVSEDGKTVVSNVAYYSAQNSTDKHVGLLIKKMPNNSTPKSKDDFANEMKSDDIMDSGDDMYNALMSGQQIPNLGDFAVSYEMFGQNLMVFWGKKYQMVITVYGQVSDKNIVFQKKLAAEIIKGI